MLRHALAAVLLLVATPAAAQTVEQDLRRLAADYERDPSLSQAVVFGVRVGDADWTVSAVPAEGDRPARVGVARGAPTGAAFVYATDSATFARIASGQIQALTTMVQARSTDPTPLRLETINGFEMDDASRAAFLSVSFHFFTTGLPEVVRLEPSRALPAHGGEALPIYYAQHLRSSWYGLAPGQHINAEARDQVNDFASIFIIIEGGSGRARIGGREIALEDDQAIFVPEGVAHEFWNPGEERATFVLLMFGANA